MGSVSLLSVAIVQLVQDLRMRMRMRMRLQLWLWLLPVSVAASCGLRKRCVVRVLQPAFLVHLPAAVYISEARPGI